MTPVLDAVAAAYLGGFSTRSDYARSNAEAVAEAACEGLITIHNIVAGAYGRQWMVTPKGCKALWDICSTQSRR